MKTIRLILWMFFASMLSLSFLAQSSASYTLEESTFNNGGDPADGVVLTSASYQITLDAVGDPVAAAALASTSYGIGSGFVPAYPPPGEVPNLLFTGASTLVWDPEPSTGTYTLYRGDVADLPGSYGSAERVGLTDETATDGTEPDPGQCLFYLVTAVNRLEEEGTKGTDSAGDPRP